MGLTSGWQLIVVTCSVLAAQRQQHSGARVPRILAQTEAEILMHKVLFSSELHNNVIKMRDMLIVDKLVPSQSLRADKVVQLLFIVAICLDQPLPLSQCQRFDPRFQRDLLKTYHRIRNLDNSRKSFNRKRLLSIRIRRAPPPGRQLACFSELLVRHGTTNILGFTSCIHRLNNFRPCRKPLVDQRLGAAAISTPHQAVSGSRRRIDYEVRGLRSLGLEKLYERRGRIGGNTEWHCIVATWNVQCCWM